MNRKTKLLNSLLLIAFMFSSVSIPVQAGTESAAARITVLNPAVETRLADRVPLAPRLTTLAGKTIYLVDDNWGGMGENGGVQDQIQAWFAQHMPTVKIVRKIKKGNFVTDDPALWKEIADNKGDGVIIGVAG